MAVIADDDDGCIEITSLLFFKTSVERDMIISSYACSYLGESSGSSSETFPTKWRLIVTLKHHGGAITPDCYQRIHVNEADASD